ncbi:MAG: CDP-diacylglycerol--glycerol-3-phosphate 3-phosphatidyltransferase [Lachnospiraceae bacterium]|nr:CDP-diacylglycerol--glycerol-3-phosphate 3-phosphatidyltransferase [Lachnospiraceae bacterium]
MNLPNKLTILRVILIPFFIAALLMSRDAAGSSDIMMRLIADGIFIVASLTDMLDGKIARKYNLITNFGKFMDPLADKLLVCSALIALVDLRQIPSWVVIIIIAREFVVSGMRLVAADQGIVIAAGWWGKFKTTFQMLMIIVMVANLQFTWWYVLGQILMWIALALTIISMVDYLWKNKSVFLVEIPEES